jgi:predicted permease
MSLFTRLFNLARIRRLDRDLDEEQQFHLEARIEDLVRAGVSREHADAQARRQFGGRLKQREASLDVRLAPWLDSLWRDLRLGVRLLRKDAVVSAAAVVSLGLAIGACTAAFSLVDALILRELPVRDPQRLVLVDRIGQEATLGVVSYPLFDRVRQATAPQMEAFSLSEQGLRQAVLADSGGAEEKLRTQFVSGNAFEVLGVTAARGRVLTRSDDVTPGGHPVAVVSHAFWTHRLGADSRAVGSWIRIEQKPYQIVGVAQSGFTGVEPGALTDVWLPNMMWSAEAFSSPGWGWLRIWGRLAPAATRDGVRPLVQTVVSSFAGEEPAKGRSRQQQAAESAIDLVDASTGLSALRRTFSRPLLALAAIVVVVLLIACSNVANLLLARGAARGREMALRASIGAGRGRLLQQVLVESSVLTMAASLLGVICASVSIPLIIGLLTTNESPVYLDAGLDWRVLAFVIVLGAATTVLFGLAPAARASATKPGEGIALGGRSVTSRTGVARPLVAAQIGFSLTILFVAGLLVRSFDRLLHVDVGFEADRLTLVSIEARDRLEPARAREANRQLLARVRAIPGVERASMSSWALFRGWRWGNNLEVPGHGRATPFRLGVSADFFRTMGTRLLDGREFAPRDADGGSSTPAIVNDAFVRRYLGGGPAVGRQLRTTSRGRAVAWDIVGVVANTRDGSLRGDAEPFLFTPFDDAEGTLEIRSSLDPRILIDRLREELPRVHPSLRLVDVTRQSSLVGNTLLRERLLAVLSGFFAVLGVALAAVGLYGVSSYAVERQARDIGIRLALGARPAAVVRAVLGGVALALGAGVAIGLGGGFFFSRFIRPMLFDTDPLDSTNIALSIGVLVLVALAATWRPARRASRVDPVIALRAE